MGNLFKVNNKDNSNTCIYVSYIVYVTCGIHMQHTTAIGHMTKTGRTQKIQTIYVCHMNSLFTLNLGLMVTDMCRNSPPQEFSRKGVLKICSRFTGEQPCRRVISIKLLWNFLKIALRHGCSPVNLLHIFKAPFYKNTSGGLVL